MPPTLGVDRVKILSIQSSVAYGHVGNSAAVFPLQRLGHEVWPVLTVHFSNHTGYGAWRGPLLAADDVREVIAGIEDRGVLGEVRRGAVRLPGRPGGRRGRSSTRSRGSRRLNPAAVYCCDPVMGDVGRGHVRAAGHPGVHARHGGAAGRHRHAQPLRARLPRRPRRPRTLAEVLDAVDAVRARGPARRAGDQRAARRRRRRARSTWSRSPTRAPGRSTTPAAADHAQRLRRRDRRALPRAPARPPAPPRPRWPRTTSSVFAVLEATIAAGTREIQLVAAQDAIADAADDVRGAPAALSRFTACGRGPVHGAPGSSSPAPLGAAPSVEAEAPDPRRHPADRVAHRPRPRPRRLRRRQHRRCGWLRRCRCLREGRPRPRRRRVRREMVPHHEQALRMVAMTRGRDLSPSFERLARQIRAAQAPEIDTMEGWLKDWGAGSDGITGHMHGDDESMGGDNGRLDGSGGHMRGGPAAARQPADEHETCTGSARRPPAPSRTCGCG